MKNKTNITSPDISKHIAKVAEDYYSEVKLQFENTFNQSYGSFPNEFINYQDRLLVNIIKSPANECWDLLNLSLRSGQHILESDIKPEKEKLKIYFIKELVDYSLEGEQNKQYLSIDKELKAYGKIGLILGYRLLSLLSQHRFHSYLSINPNEWDALRIYNGSELSKYDDSRVDLESALDRLSQKTQYKYKKETGRNLYFEDKYLNDTHIKLKPEADLYSVIWDHITSPINKAGETYFTGDISTDIINATKQNRDFPEYIKNREFIDEYRKYEKRKKDFILTKDKITKDKKTYVLLTDEIPDDKNYVADDIVDAVDKVSNINSLLDSLSDPIENQIARLKIIDGLSIRAIAERVNVSKSEVGRIIKRLNLPS